MKIKHITPEEVALGEQLRGLRLRQNLTQADLAKRADVALNAVKALETGSGATIGSLMAVVKALGRQSWVTTLQPQVTVSPMQMIHTRHVRQRASSPRSQTPDSDDAGGDSGHSGSPSTTTS